MKTERVPGTRPGTRFSFLAGVCNCLEGTEEQRQTEDNPASVCLCSPVLLRQFLSPFQPGPPDAGGGSVDVPLAVWGIRSPWASPCGTSARTVSWVTTPRTPGVSHASSQA